MLYYNRKEKERKEEKKMTREEITKRIRDVEAWIMYEECAESGYNSKAVSQLKETLKELEKALKELD